MHPVLSHRGQSATNQRTGSSAPFASGILPPGIRSRFVNDINGLTVHVLEAGFEVRGRPAIVLLHGLPELAYSWRKVMVPLAVAMPPVRQQPNPYAIPVSRGPVGEYL